VTHILNIASRVRLKETKVIRVPVLSPSSGGKEEEGPETMDRCGYLTL
jgi:hypothetical protein